MDLKDMLININMNVNLSQTDQTATLFVILNFVSSNKSGTRVDMVQRVVLS